MSQIQRLLFIIIQGVSKSTRFPCRWPSFNEVPVDRVLSSNVRFFTLTFPTSAIRVDKIVLNSLMLRSGRAAFLCRPKRRKKIRYSKESSLHGRKIKKEEIQGGKERKGQRKAEIEGMQLHRIYSHCSL